MRQSLLTLALLTVSALAVEADPYLWLENVEGKEALDWVKTQNAKTLPTLQKDAKYGPVEAEIKNIFLATDRIPSPDLKGSMVYNLWQDKDHVRGLWRRVSVEGYANAREWETVLDLDELSKNENENWVWKGSDCLKPAYERCLISLSRGGKDAVVVREFDTVTKTFVKDGFELPEAKSVTSWQDKDHLLVGTNFGADSLTSSGYPRQVRRWTRGTKLETAPLLFEGKKEDVSATGYTELGTSQTFTFVGRNPSFFETELFLVTEKGLVRSPFPVSADYKGLFEDRLLVLLREDLDLGSRSIAKGSLVALHMDSFGKADWKQGVDLVFAPDSKTALSSLFVTKNAVYLSLLDNVSGKLLAVSRTCCGWLATDLTLPENGSINILTGNYQSDTLLLTFESFLEPTTLYLSVNTNLREIRKLPHRFDTKGLITEQLFATSKDGTKVPYYVIRRQDTVFDGTNPTLLYGYGGFEISETPFYLSATGKSILEKGGVFVVGNIRGGGEFGPAWHQAALKTNRQKAYDDFIAVAEALIQTKLTSPRHLGIHGGSNGGLLMGAMLTQRPELFNAVICEVPLLDMLRFHLLLAGASWMGEYGNPEIAEEKAALEKYSPYQNVHAGKKYPKVFFMTSTKDDRVHPGHARKMAAKMLDQGHDLLYYENTEGGHGGAANLEQQIRRKSLQAVYLYQQIF